MGTQNSDYYNGAISWECRTMMLKDARASAPPSTDSKLKSQLTHAHLALTVGTEPTKVVIRNNYIVRRINLGWRFHSHSAAEIEENRGRKRPAMESGGR